MAAATADRETQRSDGVLKAIPVAASTTIYKGTLVGTNAGGYLVSMSDAANLNFQGVALEKIDNSAGANGALSCRVDKAGEHEFVYTGGDASQAKVGLAVYCQDNQSVDEDAILTTNDYLVGTIVEFISAAKVRVRIDNHAR